MDCLTISPHKQKEIAVTSAVYLKSGKVVAMPTDTVYGLAADARNNDAIAKVFAIKTRHYKRPLPVLVSSFEMLDEVAYVKEERLKKFLHAILPGKATCILPSRGWMPIELRGGGLTIGVRIPNYPLALAIIDTFGGPVTGTSANLSGNPAHTTIEGLMREFKHMPVRPDIVLDVGDLPESEPSSVIDCTVWPPRMIRSGAFLPEEFNKALSQTRYG